MQFNHTAVSGIDTAIRSMRMPMQSFDKSDSHWNKNYNDYIDTNGAYVIGPNDLSLAHNLLTASSNGNSAHSKFLRGIQVYVEITAPVYLWSEIDTYKIGTVRNSSSLQHKGASKEFVTKDFAIDDYSFMNERDFEIFGDVFNVLIEVINHLRNKYKETKDYRYFRLMRQIIPMSYEYTASWTANYEVLRNIYIQRIKEPHRLMEWHKFGEWINSLPYADDLITWGLKNDE